MRTAFITAAALATLVSAASADTTTGTIADFGLRDSSVTLTDGTTYQVPGRTNPGDAQVLTGFVRGDQISIDWIANGNARTATRISAVKGTQFHQGEVASVNATRGQLTLTDGSRYSFDADEINENPLTGFRAGDVVRVAYTANNAGISVSSAVPNTQTGTVTNIDPLSHSVTLNNGMTYKVAPREDGQSKLVGFRVGDDVRLIVSGGANHAFASDLNGI